MKYTLEFKLHYITLTNYYIVNDTLKSQVIITWKEKSN